MRLVVSQMPLKRILQWTQGVLFAVAIPTLAYAGFILADAWIFQRYAAQELARQLNDERASGVSAPLAQRSISSQSAPAIAREGLIGHLVIPRLGLSVIVAEGVDRRTLRRAVGHIPGTTLPGEPGNVGISGHRDTFFRPLRKIVPNDTITLTTRGGEYRYRVISTKVVGPTEVSVLDPSEDEILTLVTCYPFYFVGAAPDRFIVRAERVV